MSSIRYIPAIDGLRAVAVLAVMLFHLNENLLPGGFVGVDMFFVISGFLITSIIFEQQRDRKFSLGQFYQRRIARIFPVFVLVTCTSLVAAKHIYSAQDYASAGAVASFAAVSAANIKLMFQGSYFEISPDAQPFVHYWSLAVEEQFYLILPLALVWLNRGTKSRLLWKFMLMAWLASFGMCVAVTYARPVWAFYSLPTRAWELLSGSLLALLVNTTALKVSSTQATRIAILGLGLIVYSIIMLSPNDAFPGWRATVPVGGTALLIASFANPGVCDNVGSKLLSHYWLVLIGKASYSLYMWHWPVFCFVDYGWFDASWESRLIAKLGLTVGLSAITYRLIENPIRISLNLPKRRNAAYLGFLSFSLSLAFIGFQIRQANYVNATLSSVKTGGIRFEVAEGAKEVVLIGDSMGSMYGKALVDLSREQRFNVNVLSVAGGFPFPPGTLYSDSLSYIKDANPDAVIVAVSWVIENQMVYRSYPQLIAELSTHAKKVIVLLTPPMLPATCNRDWFRSSGVHSVAEDSYPQRIAMDAWIKEHTLSGVVIVDVADLFLDPDGMIRFVDNHKRQLFQDRIHLTHRGAATVMSRLSRVLAQIAA